VSGALAASAQAVVSTPFDIVTQRAMLGGVPMGLRGLIFIVFLLLFLLLLFYGYHQFQF
jgi:type IV secretory pathway VirB3-like protein